MPSLHNVLLIATYLLNLCDLLGNIETILFMAASQIETQDKPTGNESRVLYDGAQVWKVKLRSREDIALIQELVEKEDVSIWKLLPKKAIFLVQMDNKPKVRRTLSSQGLRHTVVETDVQRRVEEQKVEPVAWDDKTLRVGHRMIWHKYPTVEVVQEYMNYLTRNYPSLCKQEVIGKSDENNAIKMLTISNGNPKNKGILLVSGSHAREWIAITSALVILHVIVSQFDKQPEYVRNKDWHVIPLLNPDGYRYSYIHDRFWRKNRRNISNTHCKGVDINRNFGTDWYVTGVSEDNPCKELYSGPHPFSEPESIALRITVERLIRRRVVAMVDFHSFGQLILYPWCARSYPSRDDRVLNATAGQMRAAILEYKGRYYTAGRTYDTIYPATGVIIDWVHSSGIRHSYVIEGRDRGDHGFLMPPAYIMEAGQEMLIAVTRLAREIDKDFIIVPRSKLHWF
ncbi:hypothetical protein ABMA28_005277 [Loxostege sticticalis]|uniref:Peptidase M14 domain-containing protein n=1 Tax=Loxostege sticticalis TaxID=481309 RepID=A0ABD0SPX6_LOXSC